MRSDDDRRCPTGARTERPRHTGGRGVRGLRGARLPTRTSHLGSRPLRRDRGRAARPASQRHASWARPVRGLGRRHDDRPQRARLGARPGGGDRRAHPRRAPVASATGRRLAAPRRRRAGRSRARPLDGRRVLRSRRHRGRRWRGRRGRGPRCCTLPTAMPCSRHPFPRPVSPQRTATRSPSSNG